MSLGVSSGIGIHSIGVTMAWTYFRTGGWGEAMRGLIGKRCAIGGWCRIWKTCWEWAEARWEMRL